MIENLKNKKIAFFGTPDFTVEFLKLFKNLGLNISLIVTGEDKPAGRGMQMRSPGPKIFADVNNIKYLQPKKLLEIENELVDFDLFIVIAYGKIIPEQIINLPKYGTINLHYSLLPKYRGASPVESAILNNETESGISIQQMVYELDAGDILFQVKMQIDENETTTELRNRMNKRALEIFPDFLTQFFNGEISAKPQDETEVSKCGKFSKQDLDVTEDIKNKNLSQIFQKYKAFDKKIYFFFSPTTPSPSSDRRGTAPLRVKITDMKRDEILKVLPESRKEISLHDFENSFGKIYE